MALHEMTPVLLPFQMITEDYINITYISKFQIMKLEELQWYTIVGRKYLFIAMFLPNRYVHFG